jgi:hypothetical protein
MASPYRWAVVTTSFVALTGTLGACRRSAILADQCASQYPRPTDSAATSDATTIPPAHALQLYSPTKSLPQILTPDSAMGWYRNLFYADFAAFPRGEREVHSFIVRFNARIVGRDTAGWYAVAIPDPGPDTVKFNLLLNCIGARYGAYVHFVYARRPIFLRDTADHVLPNTRLKLQRDAR